MDLLMKFKPQKLVRQLLESFNIHITSCEAHQNILDQARSSPMIDLILALPEEHAHRLLKYIKASKAQFGQDLFVLSQSEFKTHGFFVEFGATDGVYPNILRARATSAGSWAAPVPLRLCPPRGSAGTMLGEPHEYSVCGLLAHSFFKEFPILDCHSWPSWRPV
jgi:hypothetical protein